MKIKLTLVALFAAFAFTASAQSDYKNSIGIRLGSGYYDVFAAAFKTFISEPAALEFDLGVRPHSVVGYNWTSLSLSGSYQHHFPISSIEGFQWYVGGGLVLSNTFSSWSERSGFNAGIFPTGGVDYKLKNAPFAFSADLRPTITIVSGYDYYNSFYANVGVTARYGF